jgi:hypothetical protein
MPILMILPRKILWGLQADLVRDERDWLRVVVSRPCDRKKSQERGTELFGCDWPLVRCAWVGFKSLPHGLANQTA